MTISSPNLRRSPRTGKTCKRGRSVTAENDPFPAPADPFPAAKDPFPIASHDPFPPAPASTEDSISPIDDEGTPCAGANPCKNDGECFISGAASGYKCTCAAGFNGALCDDVAAAAGAEREAAGGESAAAVVGSEEGAASSDASEDGTAEGREQEEARLGAPFSTGAAEHEQEEGAAVGVGGEWTGASPWAAPSYGGAEAELCYAGVAKLGVQAVLQQHGRCIIIIVIIITTLKIRLQGESSRF